MKRTGMLKVGMFSLACLGMILPAPLLQAAVAEKAPGRRAARPALVGIDVTLRPNGVLLGQVVDSNGKPRGGMRVLLRQLDREVAATGTDQSGYFLVRGLRGGTYEIVAWPAHSAGDGTCPADGRGIYRIWVPKMAPPSAQPGALVVVGGQRVRGQGGPIGYWLQNPWVLAGLVAAAVAIPVAIHNHRIHRAASP